MSKRIRWLLGAVLLGGVIVLSTARASEGTAVSPLPCPPGYTVVEEICYQDVVRKVCKVVPEVKKHKRIVYCVKEEDFCLTKCPCPLYGVHSCQGACCAQCEAPRCKKVLLKKEIEEEVHGFKCVVECVVERVPYKVYRRVPCPTPGAPGPATAPVAPAVLPPAR